MAEPEEPRGDEWDDDGGGPVKSFLEHLEDLRWMLIKIGIALLVSMVVCLYGTSTIVWLLKRPLQQVALLPAVSQKAIVRFGTNTLATLQLSTNRIEGLDLGTNRLVVIHADPVEVVTETGTNILLGLRVDKNPPTDEALATATDLVYLDPAQPFLTSLNLALYAGLVLAAPFIFYFIAQFVLPALKVKEKSYALRACGVGVGLFLLGVSFCYFFILPRALQFAELFSARMGVRVPDWRAETYFSFVTVITFAMGVAFELPVVLLALVKIGVLDYQRLKSIRRYMVVVNVVLGALAAPEVFTTLIMAAALQILYEISVWVAWYWEWRDRKREEKGA